MKNTLRTLLKTSLLATAGSAFLATSLASAAPRYSDVWIFGDSFSDAGATREIIPVLSSLGAAPLPAGGKLSDAKIWAEYFTEELGFSDNAQTYWLDENESGKNFSMIAASSKRDNFIIIDFPEMIDAFKKDFQKFGKNDLVVVQMGVNDALSAMKAFGAEVEKGTDRQLAFKKGLKIIDKAMESYAKQMKRLASLKARNILVLTAPDLGVAPFARMRKAEDLATKYSAYTNQKIELFLKSGALPSNVKVSVFDLFSAVRNILSSPSTYGLSANLITDRPCGFRGENGKICINPEKFFYYDLNHPTDQVNRIVAREAIRALSK